MSKQNRPILGAVLFCDESFECAGEAIKDECDKNRTHAIYYGWHKEPTVYHNARHAYNEA